MPADAGSDMAAAAATGVPDTKPLTPRSILRRGGYASSGAVEGAPRKRVTFEGSVADDKPSSGGKKLRKRAGGGTAARATARRTGGNSRLGSLLLPSYAASSTSSSGSGCSPPSTVASRATTSYDVRAPGRVRQAGCHPWPNAPHSSSSTVESPGGGRRVLSSAVAAGPTKSRGRRMFQVQEEMNRAERKATAAAAAAAAVAASASPSGSPASSAVTAAAKCSPEQQRRLERQQQQRRRQQGVRPRSSTRGGSPVAADVAAAAVEASAPPPDSGLTPPVSSSAAAVVSASTTSQTHLAPPSSQQQEQEQQQQQQQLRVGRGEDEPPSRPAAMTTAAATVVVEIDEQLPRQWPGPTAEQPPSRPTERDATGSTDITGSSRASPHADDCADGGGDWAGTGHVADGRPELRYREYAAGVSITSPPARTAPAKEEEEAAGVVDPASALEVSANEAYPFTPSGATPPAGGSGSKEDEPPAAAAIQRASDSTAAAASPARAEAGGTADNTCKNAEDGSGDFAAGSPLTAAAEVPSGIDSIEPSGSQEHSRRVAPEPKSTWTSPKCLAEIGDVALGTTPCRSQHVPPVVTPPPDDQLGRTSASQDAASGGSDRDDAISDNDRASAGRASGSVDAADGGRMGDGGSNKRSGGANTIGSRGRHKRARIDKQQGNHAGSGERGESTGGVAAPSGAVCSSPPANRQRNPVLVDASPPSTAPTASPSPCGGTTAGPCLGHDQDGGGGRPNGDRSSLSPSSPPLLPPLPPQRQEEGPETEFPSTRLLPPVSAAAAILRVPPADKADNAPPGAEPMEIVAEEEEGKGEHICASSGEVEENHGAAALPSPVRATAVAAVAKRSANGKHGEARTVASGRGRLPARFVDSSGVSAATAAGGGGDDNKGRHKRLKRPSRKMLEIREGNGEEEGVVKQRSPASASCAPAAVGVTPGTATAAAVANVVSVPSRAAGTRESSRSGENPTAAAAAAAAAAATAAEVVSAVEVGPKKMRKKRNKNALVLPTTPPSITAGGTVHLSPPADKTGRPQAKVGARRRKKDGSGGGASRSGGESQGSATAAKHRMREGHAHPLRKAAVAPRSAPEPSATPLSKPGRRIVPSPARTRSSSVAAPPAATGKVATARVKPAEMRSDRGESSGTAGVANGDVPAPAPVAASSWTGWMAPRSPRQPLLLPSQQPAVSVGRGGPRDAEHEAAVAAPAAGGVCGWMGLLSSGWKGLLSKAAGRSGT